MRPLEKQNQESFSAEPKSGQTLATRKDAAGDPPQKPFSIVSPPSELSETPKSIENSFISEPSLNLPSSGQKSSEKLVFALGTLVGVLAVTLASLIIYDQFFDDSPKRESFTPVKASKKKAPGKDPRITDSSLAAKRQTSANPQTTNVEPQNLSRLTVPTQDLLRPESSPNSPRLKFFNAYRTRTFWTLEKLSLPNKDFAVAIRLEHALVKDSNMPRSSWQPTMAWKSSSPQGPLGSGELPLDPFMTQQFISIPKKAWQKEGLDEVRLELELYWIKKQEEASSLGESKISAEKATIKIRSLQSMIQKAPQNAIHLLLSMDIPPMHVASQPGQWLTSWGKLSPTRSVSLMFAPGAPIKLLGEVLRMAQDFSISLKPFQAMDGPWDQVWMRRNLHLLSISKHGSGHDSLYFELTNKLLSTLKPDMRFKGPFSNFLCDLKAESSAAGSCSDTANFPEKVFLYAPENSEKFIQIKKSVLSFSQATEVLQNEGHLIFKNPVAILPPPGSL